MTAFSAIALDILSFLHLLSVFFPTGLYAAACLLTSGTVRRHAAVPSVKCLVALNGFVSNVFLTEHVSPYTTSCALTTLYVIKDGTVQYVLPKHQLLEGKIKP